MTIYTKKIQKDDDKKEILEQPEVILDALLEKEKDEKDDDIHIVQIPSHAMVIRRRKTLHWMMFCSIVVCVLIGLLGGVYMYMKLSQRTFVGFCGVRFTDNAERQMYANQQRRMRFHHFRESIEIDERHGFFEKIRVPQFESFQKADILHDFQMNLTAIIDKKIHKCFIIPLDRKVIKPPTDFLDLIKKMRDNYYLPDAKLISKKYRVVEPAIVNFEKLGYTISKECRPEDKMTSYRLIPFENAYAMVKRSVADDVLIYNTGSTGSREIFRIEIQN